MINNPVLPGFHPDPSIIRVESDFYMVTSSFEWFPGVPLYHSKDLCHWHQIGHLLKSRKQIDLTGVKPSRGVWAPGLSYCESERRFYLVYSKVVNRNPWLFDVENYMIWTEDILGEWSEPLYINSSGFDPSIFHDEDGTKWILNKDRDFRPENIDKRSIVIQQFDMSDKKLVGKPVVISHGATSRRFVEGAHLFKKDGWYYLFTAEGGTGYGHCVALARSASILGPYEACPHNPILSSAAEDFIGTESAHFLQPERYNPLVRLQKAGHGCLVDTTGGEWYMAHLCARPVLPQLRCILGRETAIQKMAWTPDGWLAMASGCHLPEDKVPAPALPAPPFPPEPIQYDFDDRKLQLCFCTPRNEITPDWADVISRKGFLRLRGRQSLSSNYDVSLLARRLTSFKAQVTTSMYFEPDHYHHMAGLTCYYDSESHYCVYKTYNQATGDSELKVYAFLHKHMQIFEASACVPTNATVILRASIHDAELTFEYSTDSVLYHQIGPKMDMSMLSDEASRCGCFTGAFVGMFAQDTHTMEKWAEFDWFRYEENQLSTYGF